MKRVVFLDKDGVILKVKKGVYIHNVSEMEYIDGALDAINRLKDNNVDLYIISNQAGYAYGYINDNDINEMKNKLQIDSHNAFNDIMFCLHSKEAKCQCRKPGNEFLLQIIDKYKDAEFWFVGDMETDIIAGNSAKDVKTILVLSGCMSEINLKELTPIKTPHYVAKDLSTAVDIILNKC